MNCGQAQDLMIDYMYGELQPGEAQALERHLAECSSCSLALAELGGVRQLAIALPEPEPSRIVLGRIIAQARDQETKRPTIWGFGWIKMVATLCVMAAVGGLAGYQIKMGLVSPELLHTTAKREGVGLAPSPTSVPATARPPAAFLVSTSSSETEERTTPVETVTADSSSGTLTTLQAVAPAGEPSSESSDVTFSVVSTPTSTIDSRIIRPDLDQPAAPPTAAKPQPVASVVPEPAPAPPPKPEATRSVSTEAPRNRGIALNRPQASKPATTEAPRLRSRTSAAETASSSESSGPKSGLRSGAALSFNTAMNTPQQPAPEKPQNRGISIRGISSGRSGGGPADLNEGEAALMSGEYDRAIAIFEKVLQSIPRGNPNRPKAWIGLAKAYEGRGEKIKARTAYQALAHESPSYTDMAKGKIEDLSK